MTTTRGSIYAPPTLQGSTRASGVTTNLAPRLASFLHTASLASASHSRPIACARPESLAGTEVHVRRTVTANNKANLKSDIEIDATRLFFRIRHPPLPPLTRWQQTARHQSTIPLRCARRPAQLSHARIFCRRGESRRRPRSPRSRHSRRLSGQKNRSRPR